MFHEERTNRTWAGFIIKSTIRAFKQQSFLASCLDSPCPHDVKLTLSPLWKLFGKCM